MRHQSTLPVPATRSLETGATDYLRFASPGTYFICQPGKNATRTGAARILTSGGAASALEGAENIASLIEAAAERITVIPGAGINADNILQVAAATCAREFHSGLSSMLPYPRADYAAFERGVRELVGKLRYVA